MKATVFDEPAGKFAGTSIDLPGLGKVELTHVLKQTSETTLYRISCPGVVVKLFDLGCGKPGEISYGPYLRFGLELANFEDIMAIEELRRFVPAYYGANIVYEQEFAYIAMEYLEGEDLQSWCETGPAQDYSPEWVQEFKEAVYESLSIMTRFHRHGIVLIDFKADNIIRSYERGIKFVDLGAFFTPRHHQATDKYLYTATPDYAELLIDASNMQTGIPPPRRHPISFRWEWRCLKWPRVPHDWRLTRNQRMKSWRCRRFTGSGIRRFVIYGGSIRTCGIFCRSWRAS